MLDLYHDSFVLKQLFNFMNGHFLCKAKTMLLSVLPHNVALPRPRNPKIQYDKFKMFTI